MAGIDWQQSLRQAVSEQRLIQLVVSRPSSASAVSKAVCRPVELQGQRLYQWTIRRGAQEFHENLTADELLQRVVAVLGVKYADLHWFASDGDYTVRAKGEQWQVKRKPPTKKAAEPAHNRRRNYLIPDDRPCAFLQEIGVMLPDGRIKPSQYHKFRQINRYLEFLNDIYEDLPATGPLSVVDFGCGKSSLTFAVHHYLTKIRHREVAIVGLDRKHDVVEQCQTIAQKLNCRGLQFEPGEIHTYSPPGPVNLAISLHACDTATDDALASAIRWNSEVIFAVPCCQHELLQRLPASTLPGLTEYGLFKERFAAMATDALRARYLETRGYQTQVVEFIETDHTPKNVLLRAVRAPADDASLARAKERYHQFRQELGIPTFHLETILGAVADPANCANPSVQHD